jgi:ATP-dependent Lon protease
VIRGYTREAGVRNLEREIGALCRKVARRRAEGRRGQVVDHARAVVEMLGAPSFLDEEIENRTKDPGVAVGLAWTPAGGEVLFVEASRMQGAARSRSPGHLGDVMKESARHGAVVVPRPRAALRRRSRRSTRTPRSTCTSRPARSRKTGRRPA